jgi:hypothetical protein
MLCPVCKSPLTITGQERLETLLEHVSPHPSGEISLKDKYECTNEKCTTRGIAMWAYDGELYMKTSVGGREAFNTLYDKFKALRFIGNNGAPFGSYERKRNAESNQAHDYDLFILRGWKFRVEFDYIANEDGNVLKRWRHLRIFKPSGELYISGWRMLMFDIKQFHLHLKKHKASPDLDFPIMRLKRSLQPLKDWEKQDWWRRAACWYTATYMRLFERSLMKTVLSTKEGGIG